MLWIGICEAMCVATIGGLIGGCITSISNKANNKWNMTRTESYLNEEIYQLQGGVRLAHHKLGELEGKLSTLFVAKPVNNHVNKYKNKGYSHQRHFNQRG